MPGLRLLSESGWVDFDPTNNVMPDLQHITLGWGRDFADISPLRGVLLGGGSHDPEIEVTVVPEGEFDEVYAEVEDAPSWLPGLAPTADEHWRAAAQRPGLDERRRRRRATTAPHLRSATSEGATSDRRVI